MTAYLGRGEAVPTLVADEASLSVVKPLMNILEMSRGEHFWALGTGKLLLVVVFRGDMLQQRLLAPELLVTMWTGECLVLKMQLEMGLRIDQ